MKCCMTSPAASKLLPMVSIAEAAVYLQTRAPLSPPNPES